MKTLKRIIVINLGILTGFVFLITGSIMMNFAVGKERTTQLPT